MKKYGKNMSKSAANCKKITNVCKADREGQQHALLSLYFREMHKRIFLKFLAARPCWPSVAGVQGLLRLTALSDEGML
ncbi:MAG: hypothetical protein P4N59_06490 [Negativicutes bacterium]|nr:hypothetical protein [Negativicutes bacterium]